MSHIVKQKNTDFDDQEIQELRLGGDSCLSPVSTAAT